MKQNQKKNSIPQQISKMYSYPIDGGNSSIYAVAPNPPTPEMIERAKFVDKTFKWNGKWASSLTLKLTVC